MSFSDYTKCLLWTKGTVYLTMILAVVLIALIMLETSHNYSFFNPSS